MRTIAEEALAACRDGIKAHGDAVIAAAKDVKFIAQEPKEDIACLVGMKDQQRFDKALNTRNFDEAVRIKNKMDQEADDEIGTAADLLDKYVRTTLLEWGRD